MNIQQYVEYIKAGKTINFSRFINLLPESYRKRKRENNKLTGASHDRL